MRQIAFIEKRDLQAEIFGDVQNIGGGDGIAIIE